MRLFKAPFPYIEPATAFAPLAGLPYSLFLDSADREHADARYSFVAAFPLETIESSDGRITITNARQQTSFDADPFETVKIRLKAWMPDEPEHCDFPFSGGAAGLFGYDLARSIETLPATAQRDSAIPDMAVGIYDQVIAFDHKLEKAWILTWATDEKKAEKKRGLLTSPSAASQRSSPSPHKGEGWGKGAIKWLSNFTQKEYERAVEKTIDYIRAGDIFQANISQRFETALPSGFDAFAHYLRLRKASPAPFGAYMNLGGAVIASASPERFLKLENGRVETKPIKGTRPRGRNETEDAASRETLLASEKDVAENVMIVDLMRNDLSKVCAPESVHVDTLCSVESFSSVHHLVSTISGRLKKDKTALDLLRACFPGGSVTGAPKIRAMEIIQEIENIRRGAYCGSIGYIGFDGSMDTNILIRTLVIENNRAHFNAGGGVTAQSDPAAEYKETLDKADGLLKAFITPRNKHASSDR